MKIIATFLFIIIVTESLAMENSKHIASEIFESFDRFTEKFRKTYSSSIEREKALQNFAEDYVSIKIHNFLFRIGVKSFARRVNQFSDLALNEKIDLSGLQVSKQFSRLFSKYSSNKDEQSRFA